MKQTVLRTILQAQVNAGSRPYPDPEVRRRAQGHAEAAAQVLRGLDHLGPCLEDVAVPHGPARQYQGAGYRGDAFRATFIRADEHQRMVLVWRFLAEESPGARLRCSVFAEAFGVREDTVRPVLKELVRLGLLEMTRAGERKQRLEYYLEGSGDTRPPSL